MNKALFNLLTIALLAVSLNGCDTKPKTLKSNVVQVDIHDAEAMEKRLRDRVAGRWDAILAMNYDRVYEFATPEYRKIYSVQHLNNQYGGQVRRKRARIISIDFSEGENTQATVITGVLVEIYVPGSEHYIEQEGELTEQWRFTEGDWWYLEPR